MKTPEDSAFEAEDELTVDRKLRERASRMGVPAVPAGIEHRVLGRVQGRRRLRQGLAAGLALVALLVGFSQLPNPEKGRKWVQADPPTVQPDGIDLGEGLDQGFFTRENSDLLAALPPVVELDLIEQDMVAMLDVVTALEGARP